MVLAGTSTFLAGVASSANRPRAPLFLSPDCCSSTGYIPWRDTTWSICRPTGAALLRLRHSNTGGTQAEHFWFVSGGGGGDQFNPFHLECCSVFAAKPPHLVADVLKGLIQQQLGVSQHVALPIKEPATAPKVVPSTVLLDFLPPTA